MPVRDSIWLQSSIDTNQYVLLVDWSVFATYFLTISNCEKHLNFLNHSGPDLCV